MTDATSPNAPTPDEAAAVLNVLFPDLTPVLEGDDGCAVAVHSRAELQAVLQANERVDLHPLSEEGELAFAYQAVEKGEEAPPQPTVTLAKHGLKIIAWPLAPGLSGADREALVRAVRMDVAAPIPLRAQGWSVEHVAKNPRAWGGADLTALLSGVDALDLPVLGKFGDATIRSDGAGPDILERKIVVSDGEGATAKRWKRRELTLKELLAYISTHKVGPKMGPSLMFCDMPTGERKLERVQSFSAVTLDVDSGLLRSVVEARLLELGYFAWIATTHSNMRPYTDVRQSSIVRYADRNFPDLDWKDDKVVQAYLRDEKGILPEYVQGAKFLEMFHGEAVTVRLGHLPFERYRIMLPLLVPFVIMEQGRTAKDARDAFDLIVDTIAEMLGLSRGADQSQSQANRLFYLSRHDEGTPWWMSLYAFPKMLDFHEIKVTATRKGKGGAGLSGGCFSEAGAVLYRKAKKVYKTFQVVDWIEYHSPDKLGDYVNSGMTCECPDGDTHSTGDPQDKALFVLNAGMGDHAEGFRIKDTHANCQAHHNEWDYLARMCAEWGIEPDTILEKRWNDALAHDGDGDEEPSEDDINAALASAPDLGSAGGTKASRRTAANVSVADGFAGGADSLTDTIFDDADKGTTRLNQEAAVVRIGTKVMIAIRGADGEFIYLNPADAALHFKPYQLFAPAPKDSKAKDKYVDMFAVWLKSPDRRFYNGVTCDPSMRNRPDILNYWTGFAMSPLEGDCALMLAHILNSICGGDEERFRVVMDWLAHMVQRPWEKPGFALVVAGARGVGKSIVATWIQRMIGLVHSIKIAQPRHLTGQFNAQLDGKLFVNVEEATFGGDKAGEGVLKDLVTAVSILIEAKYGAPYAAPSFCRLYLPTNEPHPIRAGAGERRWFVQTAVDVNEGKSAEEKKAYFDALAAQADAGGIEALMWTLAHRDISGFDRFRPPVTQELVEQVERSLSDEDKWVYGVLDDGVFTDREGEAIHDDVWPLDEPWLVNAGDVQKSYTAHVRLYGGSSGGSRGARRALSVHGEVRKDRRSHGDRERLMVFGPRREWQERFAKVFGVEFDDESAKVLDLQSEREKRGA